MKLFGIAILFVFSALCWQPAPAQDLGSKPAAANRPKYNSIPKYNTPPKFNTPPKSNVKQNYNSATRHNTPLAKRTVPEHNRVPDYFAKPKYTNSPRYNTPTRSNRTAKYSDVPRSTRIPQQGYLDVRVWANDGVSDTPSGNPLPTQATTDPLRIEPQKVELGVIKQGSEVRKKLVLRRPNAFQIVQVIKSGSALNIDGTIGNKSLHVLNCSVNTERIGSVSEIVAIVTNEPNAEPMIFLITAEVIPEILTDLPDSDIISSER